MSSIYAIHHASLLVSDTGKALAFYRDTLGLDPIDRPDLGYAGAWLAAGAQQLHLLELPSPDPREGRPAHGGRDRHVAVLTRDIAGVIARLEAAGIHYTSSRSGRPALFCRDPDGNTLEIIEKRGDPDF